MIGYKHTDEAKTNMSIAKQGKPGRPHSDATKEKLKEISKAKWLTRRLVNHN
jgi:NUMOD3 motif